MCELAAPNEHPGRAGDLYVSGERCSAGRHFEVVELDVQRIADLEDRVAAKRADTQRAYGDVAGSVQVKFLDDRARPADDS